MQSSMKNALGLFIGAVALSACADVLPTGPAATLDPNGDFAATQVSLQATPAGFIRIGVVPSATSIPLGASGEWTLRNKATGAVLFSGTGGTVTVDLLAAGEVRTRRWFQVTCTGNPATVTDYVTRGDAAGFETRTEDLGFCVRVLFGTLPVGSSGDAQLAFQAELAAAGLPSSGFWRTITVVSGESQLQVSHGDDETVVTDPVVIESADGVVTIGGQPYRGLGEVWTNSGGTLAGINELPLETYLYGVVPRELPPVPYGAAEAQKAQAVAARTYALANMNKRAADGYDLLPTTGDQVYGGLAAEHPISTAAVDATTGVVAVYNGALVSTLYHSTSGGFTANSEDVFANAVAYLRGVPDQQRGEALEHASLEAFKRYANPTNLRNRAEGDFESDWSIYHRWVATWTHEEMAEALSRGFTTTVNSVHDIRVVERADHGRVLRIEFDTDAGTLVALKDVIRSRLPYPLASGAYSSLRSTMFFIEPHRVNGQITGWIAYGGGWGHGVGMSQTGAVGMAEAGATYQEILAYYYQGSGLETRGL